MPVFDVHLHVQPHSEFNAVSRAFLQRGRRDLDRYARIESSPKELLRYLDEQGVDRACLINYAAPDTLGLSADIHERIIRYCRESPERLLPAGSVHPRLTKSGGADTRRLIDSGARLLKLHPPHQLFFVNDYLAGNTQLAEIYSVAQDAGLPVMIHTGTSTFPPARNRFADPMPADDVAVDFPRLKLILAHCGRPLFFDTAFFLARRHENVYLELSGIPPKKILQSLPRLEEVAHKTLWGTDWPSPGISSPSENVTAFRALALSEEAKGKILWNNAQALFP